MSRDSQQTRDVSFLFGLVAGAALGAGLAMYFAPKRTLASEIRKRMAAAADDLGEAASECRDEVSTRVADTVDALSSKARHIRDAAADTVARGAREVERFAGAAANAVSKR